MAHKTQRRRKTTRLSWFVYDRVGVYYVTLCTANRMQRFGDVVDGVMHLNGAGRIVESAWRDLPSHYPQIELDAFVIVPDHVHGLIAIRPGIDGNKKPAVLPVAYHGSISGAVPAVHPDGESGAVGAIHELPLQPSVFDVGDDDPSLIDGGNNAPPAIDDRVTRRRMLIPLVIGRLKMVSAKRINEIHGTPGQPLWQRGYYENIVRNEHDLERIRRYIANNPRRWRPRS